MVAKARSARREEQPAPSKPVAPKPVAAPAPAPAATPAPAPAGERTDHAAIRLWLRLLFCAGRIESILQSRLTREFGISLARFDLLAQLERADGGLTMTEVSRRMMVTNGATTSLVDRLVEDGLVLREAHPQDRRTNIITLTKLGRERFLAMAREHEEWVAELLGGLDAPTRAALSQGLGDLKHKLEGITE